MTKAQVPRIYLGTCVFIVCVMVGGGLLVRAPLLGILLTIILTVTLAIAPWAPLTGSLLFCVAFFSMSLHSGIMGIIDAFMAPVLCGIVAYNCRVWYALLVSLALGIAGLLEPDFPLTIDLVPTVIWIIQLVFGLAIGWLLQQRDSTVQQSTRAREELARSLHDSVAASLSSVVIRAEALAMSRSDSETDTTDRENLKSIAEASRASMRQVRQIVKVLDTSDGAIPSLSLATLHTALLNARRKLQSHGFSVPEMNDPPKVHLNSGQLDLVNRFLNESVTNVVKHGRPDSEVIAEVKNIDGYLEIQLSNEIGSREDRDLSTHYGLKHLESDAANAGGRLQVGVDPKLPGQWTSRLELSVT